jgi:hypothetical protein
MELTGIAKKDFDIWFDKKYPYYRTIFEGSKSVMNKCIIDWLDENGIYISTSKFDPNTRLVIEVPKMRGYVHVKIICGGRFPAEFYGIQKANEIYNKDFNLSWLEREDYI